MSERQREANRINGAKGGPKTFQGKQICKMNALRHGLTAKKLVLPSEDESLFNEMMEAYLEELQPQGLEETDLVREIVAAKWRQERYWALETSLMDLAVVESNAEIDERFHEIDPITKTAYALAKQHGQAKALEMVSRLEGRVRRLHQAARRDLDRLQAARPARISHPVPEPEAEIEEPISFQSFISEEERTRMQKMKNEPKFELDLPHRDPQKPKAA